MLRLLELDSMAEQTEAAVVEKEVGAVGLTEKEVAMAGPALDPPTLISCAAAPLEAK